MSEPQIPTAPATPPEEIEETEEVEEPKDKGGRRSNKQLAADNKRLEAENAAMRLALGDLARIPDDPTKPDDAVLYVLAKGGKSVEVTAGQLRKARNFLSF